MSKKKSSILQNTLSKLLNFSPILFLILTSVFGYFAYQSLTKLKIASENRYQSYLLSEQLRLSSDQLTLMARTYAVTGNKKYLNYFNDILAIRNGSLARPLQYHRVYWDLLLPKDGKPPFKSGKKIALKHLMKEQSFTEYEFKLLTLAQRHSDELTKLEFKAFKLTQKSGAANFMRNSSHSLAVSILFGEDYLKAKAKIMTYINEFYKNQEARTYAKIIYYTKQNDFMLMLALISLLCIILSLSYNFYLHNKLNNNFVNELRYEVSRQTYELKDKNSHLESVIENLNTMREQLIESEKMASLGSLVAGVAHEVNTPLGICITLASHLDSESQLLSKGVDEDSLTRSDILSMVNNIKESSQILLNNSQRAAELITSFKQIAVDQSVEEQVKFKLSEYINKVLKNLHPQLKKTDISIITNYPEQERHVNSYPGVYAQIITNLVVNSLRHAFNDGMSQGDIIISISQNESQTEIIFQDNGSGMTEEVRKKVFQPFFTTRLGTGGSGLGLSIVYNLILHKLAGTISCDSIHGKGTSFTIILPFESNTS